MRVPLGVSGPKKIQILENLLYFCLRNPVFYDQKPDFFSACGGPFYLSLEVKVSVARRRREKIVVLHCIQWGNELNHGIVARRRREKKSGFCTVYSGEASYNMVF